jgi:hypothetical protein
VFGCVVLWAGLLPSGGAVAQIGTTTIRLTGVETKLATVDVRPRGRSPGDVELVNEALYGGNGRASPIGRAEVACTLLGGTKRSCSASYRLPQGRIVTDGVIANRLRYEQAITGGTELYDNARGSLVVTTTGLRPRRQLLVFRLVDATPSTPVSPAAAQPPMAALLPPTPVAARNADRRQGRHGKPEEGAGTGRPTSHSNGHHNGRHGD